MSHLTEEQLVEHYFSEDANRIVAETHLRICRRCEQAYEEIVNALAVRAPEPPAQEPGYGKRVWQSIEAPVRPYLEGPKRRYFVWPRLVLPEPACSVLPRHSSGDRSGNGRAPIHRRQLVRFRQRDASFSLSSTIISTDRNACLSNSATPVERKPTRPTHARPTRFRPKPGNCSQTTGSTARRSPAETIP